MRTIHVTHHFEPGYGWSFESPDIPGLIGGPDNGDDFDGSCRHAESAVRFALDSEADERGEPAPRDIAFVHLVPTPA